MCLLDLFVCHVCGDSLFSVRDATTLVALYPSLCAVGPQGCPVHLGAADTGTKLVSAEVVTGVFVDSAVCCRSEPRCLGRIQTALGC